MRFERVRRLREVAHLDDRLLADIGLTRYDVVYYIHNGSWPDR
ncbi:DUF1127 domain-containing protein [Inquilinus limosus]